MERKLLYLQKIFKIHFLLGLNEMLFDIQLTDSTNQPPLNQYIPLEKLNELRLDNPKNLKFSYINLISLEKNLTPFRKQQWVKLIF